MGPHGRLPSRTTPTNVLTQSVARNLFPLNLLPRHGQLPPEALEGTLAQPREGPVHLLLVLLLYHRYLLRDATARTRGDRGGVGPVGQEPNVAVLVVVHVDLDRALEGSRGWIEYVERPPPSVPGVPTLDGFPIVYRAAGIPVVAGAIFVGNNDDCNLGVVLDGIRSVRGVRVVVLDVSA